MSRREFTKAIKAAACQRAAGHCEHCTAFLYAGKFHYDHVIADALGGEPTLDNCMVLCTNCHSSKTTKNDITKIAKVKRVAAKHIGAVSRRSSFPGGKSSKWKRCVSGQTVLR